jgi:hypothetical protein
MRKILHNDAKRRSGSHREHKKQVKEKGGKVLTLERSSKFIKQYSRLKRGHIYTMPDAVDWLLGERLERSKYERRGKEQNHDEYTIN